MHRHIESFFPKRKVCVRVCVQDVLGVVSGFRDITGAISHTCHTRIYLWLFLFRINSEIFNV